MTEARRELWESSFSLFTHLPQMEGRHRGDGVCQMSTRDRQQFMPQATTHDGAVRSAVTNRYGTLRLKVKVQVRLMDTYPYGEADADENLKSWKDRCTKKEESLDSSSMP